jgi:hypothetical protein
VLDLLLSPFFDCTRYWVHGSWLARIWCCPVDVESSIAPASNKTCSRSSKRSSESSIPTQRRIRSSGRPRAARVAASIEACLEEGKFELEIQSMRMATSGTTSHHQQTVESLRISYNSVRTGHDVIMRCIPLYVWALNVAGRSYSKLQRAS